MTFSFAPKEYRATIPSAGNISFAPAQYQTADTPRANPAPAGVVAVRDRPLVIRIANANRPRRDASADVFHRNLSQAKNLIGLGWQTGVRSLQHLQTALSCERQAFDLLSAILDDDDDGPAGALLIQLCGFALQQLATLGQGDSFDKELADQFLRLALDCAMRVTGKLAANLREQIVTALGKAAGPLPDASPFRRWLVEAQNALVAAMCDHAGRDPESAGFEA
ncbi:MAG TPA: hypothetical protein VL593_12485, partial [Ramlibacter sp.]|nr:hypothetical protein [Ramlibacter sp.]